MLGGRREGKGRKGGGKEGNEERKMSVGLMQGEQQLSWRFQRGFWGEACLSSDPDVG